MNVEAGFVVFALGYSAWGKGKSEAEALRNWKANVPLYGGREATVVFVKASDEAWIDDVSGAVVSPNDKPKPVKIGEKKVKVK
jgi:putative AlgH/UPF0301 family transcriptional regulator